MAEQHLVVVTGGRDYPYPRIVQANLNTRYVWYGTFILFHGACTRKGSDELIGADRYADDWAQTVSGMRVKRHPADWDLHGNAAGPIRNRGMVDKALSLAPVERVHGLAFPGPRSRGTWQCKEYMEKRGIEVDVWDTRRARQWLTELRGAA